MKIIFLDVDGVISSFGERGLCGLRLDMFAAVVKRTGAEVVVSSTWRMPHCREQCKRLCQELRNRGVEILDATPVLDQPIGTGLLVKGYVRGDEIQVWLNGHRHGSNKVESFVILSLRCLEWVTQGRRRRSEELFTKVLSVKGPLQMCWTVPFKKLHKDGLPMGIRGGRSRGSEMPRAKCSTVLGEENGDLRDSATHPKQRSGVILDDDPNNEMGPLKSHLVKCDGYAGLTQSDCDEIVRRLGPSKSDANPS